MRRTDCELGLARDGQQASRTVPRPGKRRALPRRGEAIIRPKCHSPPPPFWPPTGRRPPPCPGAGPPTWWRGPVVPLGRRWPLPQARASRRLATGVSARQVSETGQPSGHATGPRTHALKRSRLELPTTHCSLGILLRPSRLASREPLSSNTTRARPALPCSALPNGQSAARTVGFLRDDDDASDAWPEPARCLAGLD